MAPGLFLFFAPVSHTSRPFHIGHWQEKAAVPCISRTGAGYRELRGGSDFALFINLNLSAAEDCIWTTPSQGCLRLPFTPEGHAPQTCTPPPALSRPWLRQVRFIYPPPTAIQMTLLRTGSLPPGPMPLWWDKKRSLGGSQQPM